MPFKGIHGHTRHTHEDKVEAKKKKEEHPKHPDKEGVTPVKKEMEFYNTPFEPFTPNKPAHYVNVCICATLRAHTASTHHNMNTPLLTTNYQLEILSSFSSNRGTLCISFKSPLLYAHG